MQRRRSAERFRRLEKIGGLRRLDVQNLVRGASAHQSRQVHLSGGNSTP